MGCHYLSLIDVLFRTDRACINLVRSQESFGALIYSYQALIVQESHGTRVLVLFAMDLPSVYGWLSCRKSSSVLGGDGVPDLSISDADKPSAPTSLGAILQALRHHQPRHPSPASNPHSEIRQNGEFT